MYSCNNHNHLIFRMDTNTPALEITIISGEGLRINRRNLVKKNSFVIVKSDSNNINKTKLDTEGGSYPTWNEKLLVQMPLHERFLTVDVQCKVSSTNKAIGMAKIPVSDFAGEYFPDNYLHFLSYRLRDENGERNGIINLSIRLKDGFCRSSGVSNYTHFQPPRMIFPLADKVGSGGIVTGVPVWGR